MLYNNGQASISYDETVPCIIWTPTGYVKGKNLKDSFRVGMNFMEEKFKSHPNISWLNDTRMLRNVSQNDVRWLNINVNNRVYKLGVKNVAFVLTESTFGKLTIKIYVDFTNKRPDNKLEIKAFKTIELAKAWLKEGSVKEEIPLF